MLKKRQRNDVIAKSMMVAITLGAFLFFVAVILMMAARSRLILGHFSLKELLFSSHWDPERGQYGFFPAISGTFIVTALSLVMAVPVSVLSAIYISEYAPRKVKIILQSFIDVLAGTPSVVYGLCALLVLTPMVRDIAGGLFGIATTGMCIFTASLVLAMMVLPIIISISVESFNAIPTGLREQFLSLGATSWQLIEVVLLRAAGPGILSGIVLAFGRAFGETMAVAMVIGNKNISTPSLFSPGQTLPSLIVGSFSEMMSIPEQQSALIFVSLTLLILVILFNVLANWIKSKLQKRWRYE